MNNYKYTAKDKNGKKITGYLQANDEVDLQAKLKNDNKFLESFKEIKQYVGAKKLRYDYIADFSRNISKLSGSGVSLVKALRIICDDENINLNQKKIYQNVLKNVYGGMSLSEALAEQGEAFPAMFINMYKSAEASGNLSETAGQMAIYYEKEYKTEKKIKGSLLYPKILAVIIVIVVAVIMGYVVPQFKGLFSQMQKLPTTTKVLLSIGDFVAANWQMLIIGLILLYMLFKVLKYVKSYKKFVDRIKVRLPLIGKLMKIIYTARFARTLSSLYDAGIPIVTCLNIAKDTIDNSYISSQFDKLINDIKSGIPLSQAVRDVDGFTTKLSTSILVGEETGELDTMLSSIADQLEYDSEVAVSTLVAMIEPVMIVIMAVIIGFIMISVIQPIYGSYEQLAQNKRLS